MTRIQQQQGGPVYGPVDGDLFVRGVTFDDIRQGDIGDCYFVSSLSAVAEANPRFIQDSIKTNPDGTFTVRFFQNGKPVHITVDNALLHSQSGRLIYGSSTDKGELWVAVMEKAYAQWKGSYKRIGQGGDPAKALYELTGVKSRLVLDRSTPADTLYLGLQQALENHEAAVAGTYSGPRNVYAREGLVAMHAYTVIGVREEEGQKFVVLRNPWGSTEWNGLGADNKDNGIFKMPIGAFQQMFGMVAYSRAPLKITS